MPVYHRAADDLRGNAGSMDRPAVARRAGTVVNGRRARNGAVAIALAAGLLGACVDEREPFGPADDTSFPVQPQPAMIVHGVTEIPTLGGAENRAHGINDLGQIVGQSFNTEGVWRAFRWENGSLIDPGTANPVPAAAWGIDAQSRIVGSIHTANGTRGFIWRNGVMDDLGTLGGDYSEAFAINARGEVVGMSTDAERRQRAFVWRGSLMHDLGALGDGDFGEAYDINDRGQVVGRSGNPGNLRAFLWEDGVMQDLGTLPGGGSSKATAINERGQVAGEAVAASGHIHAFLWQDGVMQDLGTLGGARSEALGINDLGQVVGVSDAHGGLGRRAFLWQDGTMYDLGALGGDLSIAQAINNHGEVVGYVRDAADMDVAVRWIVPIRAEIEVRGGAGNPPNGAIGMGGPDRITAIVRGNRWFNAANVDPSTVTLGNDDGHDTSVTRRKKGDVIATLEDADRDGFPDLVLEFSRQAMVQNGDLSTGTTRLVLLGRRTDGRQVRGVLQITVLP